MKKFRSVFLSLFLVLLAASVSFATTAPDPLAGVSIDNTKVLELAGMVLAAIGGIWAVKKLIALGNKS